MIEADKDILRLKITMHQPNHLQQAQSFDYPFNYFFELMTVILLKYMTNLQILLHFVDPFTSEELTFGLEKYFT